MTDVRSNSFINVENSASLGHAAHVENVPVGFMTLATCPLILWLLDGTVAGFASALVIIALFAVGLYFLSIGQKAHLLYDSSEIAKRPAIPYKLIGSFLLALVIGLLSAAKIVIPAIPMLLGFITFVLCLVAFGLDPMRNKGFDNPRLRLRMESESLCHAFDTRFEQLLFDLESLRDDDLTQRVRVITDTLMGLIRTVDFETEKLKQLSKPLSKLLAKMEDETASLIVLDGDPSFGFARRKYLLKMQTMASAFEARARKTGIAHGMNSFELQADLLFDRIQRKQLG